LSLSNTVKTAKLGLHIYTFGVVFQQALILCFLALTIVFQQKLKSNYVGDEARRRAMSILHVLRASLILISVRLSLPQACIFGLLTETSTASSSVSSSLPSQTEAASTTISKATNGPSTHLMPSQCYWPSSS
jgi:hypothetical protein